MAKVIFTSRYLKGKGKKELGNYVNYIATRDNVDTSVNILMLEKENFVGYMANRPRAEHGLFSSTDNEIDLDKVKEEVANHKGNIWTTVISLRRADAERLGYDNADAWKDLVRSKQEVIAKNMGIHIENLKWYAAFHNEAHHPHIHLLVYSQNPKHEFLTNRAIENMRSSFANEIFKQDLISVYQQKTVSRDNLKNSARELISNIVNDINNGRNNNPYLETMLLELCEGLKTATGKKQYGYLKADLKKLVDDIVKELASDDRISELYKIWCEIQNEILATYKTNFMEHPPLWEQKEFKSIRNVVIAEALNISEATFYVENTDEINQPNVQQINYSNIPNKPVSFAVARLLHNLGKIIENDCMKFIKKLYTHTEGKLMKEILEKKSAQGLKF